MAILAGALGETERGALSALAALEPPTVTADDLVRTRGVKRAAANLLLSRLARKGWLHRRRGVYAIVPLSSRSGRTVVENPLALAMELFSPCYISSWTAAQHWDLTEQIFNAVVVCSARPQRRAEQLAGGVTYRVRRISERTIFGTTRIWSGTGAVQMASVHRTVIDVLDAPEMGGGGVRRSISPKRTGSDPRPPQTCCSIWPGDSGAERSSSGSASPRSGSGGRPTPGWLDVVRTCLPASRCSIRRAHGGGRSSPDGGSG